MSKKMIFSAVALVAFSFAGMANGGTVEECQKEYKTEKDRLLATGEYNEVQAQQKAKATFYSCRSRKVNTTKSFSR